ncbi:DMT family transporter [Paraburkholderia sp.]|uniref:DMT family transporter n=1 Tax=Paraburkholderia sp. TaxID=1926495 RepID=UPI00238661D7|nr:DMT family transporter [Paraburkholderia sp.]MDE1179249.1 DMT family transporter [Paraburkholderia sp.]
MPRPLPLQKFFPWPADSAEAGIALMLLTTATFAGSDSIVKGIGSAVPIVALLWVRYLFQAVVLGVWQVRRGLDAFRNARPVKLQILRAFLLLLNSASTFAGLRYLPLPVTTSLAMMAPLITTLLAATILNEAVPRSKWALVILGFIGMLMVVRPGSGEFTWTVVFPIAAATTFACFQVVSSKLSKTGDPVTTNFITALVATVALTVLVWADQNSVLPEIGNVRFGSWMAVLAMASVATFGQMMMLQALRRTPLAVLTPFGYAQLAFATLYSWMFFGQVPDFWMAAGMCVIAISGIGTVMLHGRSRTSPGASPATGEVD